MTAQSELVPLDVVAAELYSDLRLAPLLRRLLARSGDLVGATAGSFSMVDDARHRYVKLAEHGAFCRLGQTFPLDEGVTGQVFAKRRPVVFDRYGDVPHGHVAGGNPAQGGAVAAIPVWWRGDVLGVNILFAGAAHRFTSAEVDQLEMISQLAAAGIVQAGAGDPSLSELIRRLPRSSSADPGQETVVTEVGVARPLSVSVTQVALDLVTLMERTAAQRASTTPVHVAVVHRADGLRLLVHAADDSDSPSVDRLAGAPAWQELVDTVGGGVEIEQIRAWGTVVRADLPYLDGKKWASPMPPTANPAPTVTSVPPTPREFQVLELLAEGAADKTIAEKLAISRKTVEKHVSAVLRKTGTESRTAAVMCALDREWLPGRLSRDHPG